jgi:hypothetical protein
VTTEEGQALANRMGTLFVGTLRQSEASPLRRQLLTMRRVLGQDQYPRYRRLPGARPAGECVL